MAKKKEKAAYSSEHRTRVSFSRWERGEFRTTKLEKRLERGEERGRKGECVRNGGG